MEKRAGVGEKSQRWSQNEAADGIRSGHGGRWLFEFSASRAFLTSSDARCSCRRFNRAQRGLLSRAWAGELSPPLMMCVNPRRPVRELLGRRGLRQSATVCRATRLIDALSSALPSNWVPPSGKRPNNHVLVSSLPAASITLS